MALGGSKSHAAGKTAEVIRRLEGLRKDATLVKKWVLDRLDSEGEYR